MTEFDSNGFMSGRIELWVKCTRAKHDGIVSVADETNRLCHDFLSGRDAKSHGPKAFVAALLFARMLELFQGVVLLTLRGMPGVSSVVFRSFVEAH